MLRTAPRLAILAISGTLALAGSPAAAGDRPGETRGLGLMGPDMPPLLKEVVAEPYRAPAEPACQSIPREIAALNDVLGPDADEPVKAKSKVVSDFVGGAVRRMIPYRGVVRFLTRAGEKDKALTEAWMAGFARRGYLRGVEANLHCAAPQVATAAGIDASVPASEVMAVDVTRQIPNPAPASVAETIAVLPAGPGR